PAPPGAAAAGACNTGWGGIQASKKRRSHSLRVRPLAGPSLRQPRPLSGPHLPPASPVERPAPQAVAFEGQQEIEGEETEPDPALIDDPRQAHRLDGA